MPSPPVSPPVSPSIAPSISPPQSRIFRGSVNWIGLWTLYLKEVRRFMKVGLQTILAPVVTTLLFVVIFTFALGDARPITGGVDFKVFLIPGLVMMGMMQNAFANTSSVLVISKIQGNIVDYIMPPISPEEMNFGLAMGGVTRGVIVGTAVTLASSVFVSVPIAHPWAILYFGISGCLLMSLLGTLVGVWSYKFDHMMGITNFIITPLTMLSGTFYSVSGMPSLLQTLSHWNPIFYMIDGFRYGFIGHADSSLTTGVLVAGGLNIVAWGVCQVLIKSGWRIKT